MSTDDMAYNEVYMHTETGGVYPHLNPWSKPPSPPSFSLFPLPPPPPSTFPFHLYPLFHPFPGGLPLNPARGSV